MKQRTITAILMIIILVPFFLLGNIFSTVLLSILAYIGTYEIISIHQQKSNIPNICKYIIPLFSSMIVLIISYFELIDIVYVLLVQLMCLMILPIFNKKILFKDVIIFIFSIIYCGVCFGIVSYLRNINLFKLTSAEISSFSSNLNPDGLLLICYVLLVTMSTDIFAYIFGIKFGKHRLCPTISPKKSIEGAIFGTVFGAIFGTIFMIICRNYFSSIVAFVEVFKIDNIYLYILISFAISIVLSIAGQLGDLIASKIKREYDVKDFGKIFPGHGGVLDRFDSAIYGCLVFAIILLMLEVI